MDLIYKYDTGDLRVVRKADIHKMCIGFSRKACVRQQVFTSCVRTTALHHCTSIDFFSLLYTAWKLGLPVVWSPLWLKVQELWEPCWWGKRKELYHFLFSLFPLRKIPIFCSQNHASYKGTMCMYCFNLSNSNPVKCIFSSLTDLKRQKILTLLNIPCGLHEVFNFFGSL